MPIGMPRTHDSAHPPASALERRITVVAVVLPFAGFLVALWLLCTVSGSLLFAWVKRSQAV